MARTYQSVSFLPHITLAGTPEWPEEKIKAVIDDIAKKSQSFELKTSSVRCSSNPYQKLTHGVQGSEQLSSVHQMTNTGFSGEFAKKAYPHISYLYSRVHCSEVSDEIDRIEKDAPPEIAVNRLALVQCKGTPEDWRVLFSWKMNN